MSNERAEFSKRLAAAMIAQGYDPRPGVLSTQFNVRFKGASVTFTTASRWLNSGAIPEYEKLIALADWLKADPCFLLFGDRVLRGGRETRQVKEDAPVYDDQKVFDVYRTLPATQQKAVCEVIMAFAAAPSRRSSPAKVLAGTKSPRRKS
jgi:transcriptional regulator with XRE-family HTH domain